MNADVYTLDDTERIAYGSDHTCSDCTDAPRIRIAGYVDRPAELFGTAVGGSA